MKEHSGHNHEQHNQGSDVHGHHHHHAQGNIKIAFFLNLFFTIIEIIGGLLTNSMAILSDALHDLGDSLALGIAWYLEKYSKKAPDSKFSFGYARFSILGALINGIILVCGAIVILSQSIPRLLNPEQVNPKGMLIVALLGILVNGLAVLRLKRGSSLNERVVSWHLLEDVFGWIVILISSIVLMFVDLPIIDPLLSIVLTLYVLKNVIKNLNSTLNVLLEGVPENFVVHEIANKINTVNNVISVHHLHIWTLEGEKNFLSTHIVISEELGTLEIIEIKNNVRELLSSEGIEHATLEIEFDNEDCENKICE